VQRGGRREGKKGAANVLEEEEDGEEEREEEEVEVEASWAEGRLLGGCPAMEWIGRWHIFLMWKLERLFETRYVTTCRVY